MRREKFNITKFLNIYSSLKELHIVPRWKWSEKSLCTLNNILDFYGLPHFTDDVGNIILNCADSEKLERELVGGSINQIIQAHLDHPGAIVTSNIDRNSNLYSAEWLGGYSISLEGRELLLYDAQNESASTVKVEFEVNTSAGRFIYFYCDKEVNLHNSFLHHKDSVPEIDKKSGALTGWALDDLVGCSVIIHTLSEQKTKKTIGLLTLGEEIGGYGIEAFCERFLKNKKKVPYFINIDMPEEEDKNFKCGNGAWIRTEDKRAHYDRRLVKALKNRCRGLRTISLTKGGTEAGNLVERGYCAAGLAIPIRNIHNGSRHSCLVDESVFIKDIISLYSLTSTLISNLDLFITKKSPGKNGSKTPVIKIKNHAENIIDKIRRTKKYSEYLLEVSDYWNRLNFTYKLSPVYLSLSEYEKLKNQIGLNSSIFKNVEIKKLASGISLLVGNYISTAQPYGYPPMHIATFLKANFNACNTNGVIALSLDKINKFDVGRILAHEMVHWFCNRCYKGSPHNDLLQLLIFEGTACFISKEIAKTGDAETLGISQKTYKYYVSKCSELKKHFRDHVCGNLVSVEKAVKHRTIRFLSKPHPFKISKDNKFNKYGYFLGLNFIKHCIKNKMSVHDIYTQHNKTQKLFDEFVLNN